MAPSIIVVRGGGDTSRWRGYPVDQLIAAFNREVGNDGTGAARTKYLLSLRVALLESGLDCSSFIDDRSMSLDYPIVRDGERLVQARPNRGP